MMPLKPNSFRCRRNFPCFEIKKKSNLSISNRDKKEDELIVIDANKSLIEITINCSQRLPRPQNLRWKKWHVRGNLRNRAFLRCAFGARQALDWKQKTEPLFHLHPRRDGIEREKTKKKKSFGIKRKFYGIFCLGTTLNCVTFFLM